MEKAPTKSRGYLVLHTILCVIAALILFGCISHTFIMRHFMRSNALTDSLRAARLSDASIPLSGQTLSQYIRSGFVEDEAVLPEDIAEAVDSMKLPEFFADKIGQHLDLLRGRSDTPMTIESGEITDLLDNVAEQLRSSCLLIISDADKQAISDACDKPLSFLNGLSRFFGGSKAGRAFQRFSVSLWAYVLEILLLVLLAWRWMQIRKNAGRDTAGAFKGLGLTKLIPSAILLLFVIVFALIAVFRNDAVIGLSAVTKIIRAPLWYTSITGVTFAIFLLELCAYLRWYANKPKTATETAAPAAAKPAAEPVRNVVCTGCGKEIPEGTKFCKYCGAKQEQPEPVPAPEPVPPVQIPVMTPCVSCGREINSLMKFCQYCGANQEAAKPADGIPSLDDEPASAPDLTDGNNTENE